MTHQSEIADWFDQTYKEKGFAYLRKAEAYKIFRTILNPQRGEQALDVACGPGLMLKEFVAAGCDTYGVDISAEAIEMASKYCPEASVQVGNAIKLPFEDATFDHITCLGSLERMEDRDRALQEQLRVSKNGGQFCYMLRNAKNFTWKYIKKPFGLVNHRGHQDAMDLSAWRNLFERNGLEIIDVFPDHWPYFKTREVLTPWRRIDYSSLKKFPFSISLAYEFIFHLRKR